MPFNVPSINRSDGSHCSLGGCLQSQGLKDAAVPIQRNTSLPTPASPETAAPKGKGIDRLPLSDSLAGLRDTQVSATVSLLVSLPSGGCHWKLIMCNGREGKSVLIQSTEGPDRRSDGREKAIFLALSRFPRHSLFFPSSPPTHR